MFGDGKVVCSVVVVIVDCPSERDKDRGAVDTVLWRDVAKELNEGELCGGCGGVVTDSCDKDKQLCRPRRRDLR